MADVNIPVGEVFTSPVLEGTNGVLHVSRVYLDGLQYKDLELKFKDGKIVDYRCGNFKDEEEGRRYIFDNVLKNHVTVMINHFTLEEETGDHILNINMSCLKQEGEGLAIEEDTLEENKTEVSYVFDKEEIEALARNKDNFTGKIYAYNYSTGQRDRILSSTESYITGESLNSYLSGDGEMRITYKMDASDEYGPAPVLSLIYKKQ